MGKRFYGWNTSKKIVASFLVVIFVGSLLLALPISQADGTSTTYFEHLFHAVSLVSVTGFLLHPVNQTYSLFGQIISLFLMQVGGLGLITIVAGVMTSFGKRIPLRERLAVLEGINQEDTNDFRTYLLSIIKYVLVIEGAGFVCLAVRFVPDFGWGKGLFTALYLAVSSFTNAGFDNLGSTSLQGYVHDPFVNLVLPVLIILGGIGFSVWFDFKLVWNQLKQKKGKKNPRLFFRYLSLHSRIAVTVSFFLLLSGTLFFFLVEFSNAKTIGDFTLGEKIMTSFFQAVTMRTAGLTTIDFTYVYPFTLFWFILHMFIGGSPGSTAGGLKTTTFAMVVLFIYNEVRGQNNVNIWNNTIPASLVRNAFVIFTAFLSLFVVGTGLLTLLNPDVEFIYLMFETISAITTVGMSAGITSSLGTFSHVILMVLMFAGRIGPITLAESLVRKGKETKNLTYRSGKILIG